MTELDNAILLTVARSLATAGGFDWRKGGIHPASRLSMTTVNRAVAYALHVSDQIDHVPEITPHKVAVAQPIKEEVPPQRPVEAADLVGTNIVKFPTRHR